MRPNPSFHRTCVKAARVSTLYSAERHRVSEDIFLHFQPKGGYNPALFTPLFLIFQAWNAAILFETTPEYIFENQ